MKITSGDIFKIPTGIGFGFLQFIELDSMGIEYIRVLDIISENGIITQFEIDKTERWCIGFPLRAASRKKIVERIGNFNLPPDFKPSDLVRSEHIIGDKFLGWFIVNRKTLKRKFKKKLNKKQLKLSPHGIMNDTLIIERLEGNWNLAEWGKKAHNTGYNSLWRNFLRKIPTFK